MPLDLLPALLASRPVPTGREYSLSIEIGGAYVGHPREGSAAFIVPLCEPPSVQVGRSTAGLELHPHHALVFSFDGREWTAPAAALVCRDGELLHEFAVLAGDVMDKTSEARTWAAVLAVVEDWMALMMPRGKPSPERELGLWAELWLAERCVDVDRALDGWCGPNGDPTDFFIDGMGLELKTSGTKLRHHVSQLQADSPIGTRSSWLLSIWAKADPESEVSVPSLATSILARSDKKSEAIRKLARAGYVEADRRLYDGRYVVVEEPHWFDIGDVPRVRLADAGVSNLRFSILLDPAKAADDITATRLWRHFTGRKYWTAE